MTYNSEPNCFNAKTSHFRDVVTYIVTECVCVCDIIQPVCGVRQSAEQEVKEAGEFSLQSLTHVVLQFLWLSWALRCGLGLHAKQQVKKGLSLLHDGWTGERIPEILLSCLFQFI